MNWLPLDTPAQLDELIKASSGKPQVIFKHSTRCGISSMAKNRLERAGDLPEADYHFLDLIRYRELSNAIAETFRVWHESPQLLVIKDGQCVSDTSHTGISVSWLEETIDALRA